MVPVLEEVLLVPVDPVAVVVEVEPAEVFDKSVGTVPFIMIVVYPGVGVSLPPMNV